MKKIILTGATGLIGKETVEPLKEKGFEVYSLTSKECNLFNFEEVSSFFEKIKPEYLLHFAWITGGDYLTNQINCEFVNASMNMLNAFRNNGGKRAVFAGTCFEYMFKHESINEFDALDPKTLYAQSKVILFNQATSFCKQNNISFGWGRIFYVYGHKEKEDRLTSYIINNLRHNKNVEIRFGQLQRDYMYSKDIAKAFVSFIESDVEGAVNICTGKTVTLGELALCIAKYMHKEKLLTIMNEESSQPLKIVGDNTKLVESIGFNSFTDYRIGLEQIIAKKNNSL